jgi:protein gp37
MPTVISWTQETWNSVTGCSRISEGCRHCYAERMSLKNKWSIYPWTAENAERNVVMHFDRLNKPRTWKDPRLVFVNSMGDMFHRCVTDEFIRAIFQVMCQCAWHTFQCLTKRPERAREWPGPWAPNIWMGTSIENRKSLSRLDAIRECGAWIRFVSFEPLLEELGTIDLTKIDWVIVGGESGPHYRPMDHAWARSIRDQCRQAGVPFFFKQSAAWRTEMGTQLIEADGRKTTIQEYPVK